MPLVSKEGLTYLEFIGKETNEDVAPYPLFHLTSTHPWDPTMLDATNPYHSLTTDGVEHGSPTGTSDGSQLKTLSKEESVMTSSDPDVTKIHLQPSLCKKLTPMKTFSHYHY